MAFVLTLNLLFYIHHKDIVRASLVAQTVKNLPAIQEPRVQSLGRDGPLEKGMAPHSSILAWRIPWAAEPGGLQSMGSQSLRHDWATKTYTHGNFQMLCHVQYYIMYSKFKLILIFDRTIPVYDFFKSKIIFIQVKLSLLSTPDVKAEQDPMGLLGTRDFLCPSFPDIPWVLKVHTVANQGREGTQRRRRSSQQTIVQPWGRVLIPLKRYI